MGACNDYPLTTRQSCTSLGLTAQRTLLLVQHRDTDANWDPPVLSQHIKVFVYFSDVSENGGCTAIVSSV